MNYTEERVNELRHRWTTPKGKKLIKLIKESRCYLSPVLFKEKVHNFPGINDPELEDGVDLRGAPLAGFDFRVPIQEDEDGFSEEIAILSEIHMEGAILKYSNFQNGKIHDCFFEDAELSHAEFKGSTLNNCSFQEAECSGVNFHGAKIINCNFIDAHIKDMILEGTIVDPKTNFGKILKSEKEGHYHFASIEYKQIKQMYKNSSLHGLADEFHYKKMVVKRKLDPMTSPKYWMDYIFGDLLCKYGTSFTRVLLWSILLIILCAFVLSGPNKLIYEGVPVVASFLDALYFSIVTFTTLGYGDYNVFGPVRFIAAGEAFLGAALMALFTVIVARNLIRD